MQPWLFRSYSKQQPAPLVDPVQQLKLADARQQLAEPQQQQTALQHQLAPKDVAHQQQLAEKEQQVAAL